MPKIITSRRRESEYDKALEYVKGHILFPSGLLGLIFMVAGMASLAYQYMVISYGWRTFVESLGLLFMGGLFGWVQTRYHQYVLREYPGYFASRMRLYSRSGQRRLRKELPRWELVHQGRQWVPLAYILGIGLLLGISAWSAVVGQTYYLAAFLMPWAGFFWARMFFWRGVLTEVKSHK
jgi:hypothetical protein